MPRANCHCGAIGLTVPSGPDYLIDCNCSICRRYGILWALYESTNVEISGHPEGTVAYIWGERSIQTMHCRICGCVTHWEPLTSAAGTRFGVNMRNFESPVSAGVEVRKFDGAKSWAYVEQGHSWRSSDAAGGAAE